MPQLFRPQADLILRLSALGVLVAVVGAVLTWHASLGSAYGVGEAVDQPIPFSHKHHVSDDGIDCRYCHTSVEDSSFAGIPPTHTCMTCHSQLFKDSPMLARLHSSLQNNQPLRWLRVDDLPDFVYFNHSIHIAKGVGCVTCHGRVDRMPLTWRAHSLEMQWCLRCHRAPERFLRPREHVFDMDWAPRENQISLGKRLIREYHIDTARLTECSVCHR